jgi:sec-independent protein translocase protein TatC
VVLVLLTKIGVVDAKTLARQRKYAILIIFIFAAVITPPDIISQVLMALPLMGLYELSILFSKFFRKSSVQIPSEEDTEKVKPPITN